MKLWQKKYDVNKEVEKFTVGNDFLLDLKLVCYDCAASIAHAKMLKKIGILNDNELKSMIEGLKEIIRLNKIGKFEIRQEDEDCHTAIENYLVKKCGEIGKKINTARSRNDQVLTALRLYEKDALKEMKVLLVEFCATCNQCIGFYGTIQMPGYTHMQKAMPMTVAMWLGSFVDSMKDAMKLIDAHMSLIDQSPLGSAAGFGVPIDVNRKMTAEELHFSKVMENPLYCQLSRGKFEADIIHLVSQIMFDLNKLATDILLFSMKEFGYIELPAEICTGSSIMPQKKNPDVLLLVRAKYHVVAAEEFKVKNIMSNLMSGYNRDVQLTKEPLFNAIEITTQSLQVMMVVIAGMAINKQKCAAAMTPELFATEEAYKLVKNGLSFRDAYKEIGKRYI